LNTRAEEYSCRNLMPYPFALAQMSFPHGQLLPPKYSQIGAAPTRSEGAEITRPERCFVVASA
jgi:hypothetical protein